MKHIFLLLFFSIAITGQTRTGIIKGRVADADNDSNSMIGANVILISLGIGAGSDINGYYEIKNVPLGKYIIQCSSLAYATQKDTIELTEDNSEITKDFHLTVLLVPISMPDSLKEYHKHFAGYKPEDIINIFIDSLSSDYRTFFLTFTNKTKYPVYLIEDLQCFETLYIVVKNESGKNIQHNILNGCDVIRVTLPKKENLIELKPKAEIRFASVIRHDYSLDILREGKYYISLMYEIKDFKYLPGLWSNPEFDYNKFFKEEMEVLNQATRGRFYSANEIVMEK